MVSIATFQLDSQTDPAALFFTSLGDIGGAEPTSVNGATLNLLSIVETAKIPLCLVSGPPLVVETDSLELESWFTHVLLGSHLHPKNDVWWTSASSDSQLGILVSVKAAKAWSRSTNCPVTELLIYATKTGKCGGPQHDEGLVATREDGSHTPKSGLQVQAVPLSSHLLTLTTKAEPTPPASPAGTFNDDAVFLPSLPVTDVVNEVQVRKRKSTSDIFDEAAERRKKPRRKEFREIATAGAAAEPARTQPDLSDRYHRRSVSNSQHVCSQARALSRSPSVASSRPGTGVAINNNRSTLSRVQYIDGSSTSPGIEAKNKDTISRVVMAGMRLYGLSQKRSRKSQHIESLAIDSNFEDLENDRKRDEEYKNIYHQAFKGTCFAFRTSIGSQDMQPISGPIRDVVDRLLAIFCNDPLGEGLSIIDDKLTPGGRKAFGIK